MEVLLPQSVYQPVYIEVTLCQGCWSPLTLVSCTQDKVARGYLEQGILKMEENICVRDPIHIQKLRTSSLSKVTMCYCPLEGAPCENAYLSKSSFAVPGRKGKFKDKHKNLWFRHISLSLVFIMCYLSTKAPIAQKRLQLTEVQFLIAHVKNDKSPV